MDRTPSFVYRPWRGLNALVVLLALVLLSANPRHAGAAEDDLSYSAGAQLEAPAAQQQESVQNYSGLADLVSMICENALDRFQGFYGPSVVMVKPFALLGDTEPGRSTELGVTLADQMTAMINNETKDRLVSVSGSTPQTMQGVLQEVGGYLRVHMSGVNAAGQRTSYVVIVEMSESIYRALHTYL